MYALRLQSHRQRQRAVPGVRDADTEWQGRDERDGFLRRACVARRRSETEGEAGFVEDASGDRNES